VNLVDRFVETFLAIYRDYKGKWGLIDIYAYKTLGRSVKAFASLIMGINGEPRTINAYLLSNGEVAIISDVTPVFRGSFKCGGQLAKLTVDMYLPQEEYTLCLGARINELGDFFLALTGDYGEERVVVYGKVPREHVNYGSLVQVLSGVRGFLVKVYSPAH
jgi:hypothetical protein